VTEAALQIIADQGLRRFTTSALAKATGISEGAMFRHFASKAEIVTAAVAHIEEVLFARFPPEDPDPIARLGRFFLDRVEIVRANPAVGAVMGSEQLLHASEAGDVERLRSFRARSGGFVRQCLDEARRRKLLDRELSPDVALVMFMGTLFMLTHGTAMVGDAAPSKARAAQVWGALERVLRGGAGRPPPA
jgi:AcrR family transcriptional regulator